MNLKRWLWSIWHTRPGHKSCGIVVNPVNTSAWCAACGAPAPGGKE